MAAGALKKSFIQVSADSHFPIQNLPWGVFRPSPNKAPRPGVAIGDYVLDLLEVDRNGLFDGPVLSGSACFQQTTLNKFISMGRPAWKEARQCIQTLLSDECPWLRDNRHLQERALVPMRQVEMVLPVEVGDYTDFYSSIHHANNCTKIVHGHDMPLNPNWLSLPVAYHGRASSVVVSETPIVRPRGQGPPVGNSSAPYYGPSLKLDFELEMAAIVGPGNELGKPIDIKDAKDHIFGLVLMNDWSARDIQGWEMLPLGPFLGKSFCTSISPWVVTLDALEPFACEAPKQDPSPLPYLTDKPRQNYDISLEVSITPAGEKPSVVSKTNLRHLYWTLSQQLAHQTVNGCNVRPGDLLGTGTLSGPTPDSLGCLFELTWNAQKPLLLKGSNKTMTFLEDGDEVTFTGVCKGNGYSVGFGTCTGKVVPSP